MSSRKTLLVVLASSTLLKLLLLLAVVDLRLGVDEGDWLGAAVDVAEQGVPSYQNPIWDEAHWPPVYIYLGSGLYRLFGDPGFRHALRVVQVLLSTLTAWCVYEIGRRAFDERVGVVSAVVTAFHPSLVSYTHYFLSETVFIALYVGVLAALLPGTTGLSPRRAALAGALGGLAVLTRSVFVVQAPLVAAWILLGVRAPLASRARASAAFLLAAALVVAPWSLRNTLRYERFLLVDTAGAGVLHKCWNSPRPWNQDIGLETRYREDRERLRDSDTPYRSRSRKKHVVERYQDELGRAVGHVLEYPGLFLRNCAIRTVEMVNPTSNLVIGLRRLDYGRVPRALRELLVLAVIVASMALFALGSAGMLLWRMDAGRALAAVFVLATAASCVFLISMSRYRLPLVPPLIPFAVHAALHLSGASRERSTLPAVREQRWRWGVLAALLVGLGWAWVVYTPNNYLRA